MPFIKKIDTHLLEKTFIAGEATTSSILAIETLFNQAVSAYSAAVTVLGSNTFNDSLPPSTTNYYSSDKVNRKKIYFVGQF